ncbi:uncharacterized protein LOC106464154 isoform X2 [Limulus polyphemus]|uniref:Uncharacterized protein LOC106464154 isoform X2 n=1 Tax=Limulus polyphemus TaxID=6850 RepID=A0ABM1BDE2_LIMPO|nr:uncharacterized protein LOC106464154 isoform X2 [Limulus polyphemus]
MPRVENLFVRDFLYPSLQNDRFPGLLQWTDKAAMEYEVKWKHKSSGEWQDSEFEHFGEWDKLKGKYNPRIPGYWTLSKQRFRNTHRKLEMLGKIVRLQSRRGYRKYKICCNSEIKRKIKLCAKPKSVEMKRKRPVILKVDKMVKFRQVDTTGKETPCNNSTEMLLSIPPKTNLEDADNLELEKLCCWSTYNINPNYQFIMQIPSWDTTDSLPHCADILSN